MIAESTPRDTTRHRQPRPADPNLVQLDRRITWLEQRGSSDPPAACRVVRLRQKFGWLVRDQAQKTAQWYTDGANLALAIEREERYRA